MAESEGFESGSISANGKRPEEVVTNRFVGTYDGT